MLVEKYSVCRTRAAPAGFPQSDGTCSRVRPHGEADHRFQVRNPKLPGQEFMYRFYTVADGGDGKARSVERLRRIAGRRGAPITKELGGNRNWRAGACPGPISQS